MLTPASLSPNSFKTALGSLASGVTVITMRDSDGVPLGMTATAFSSVSVDPLLVMVCVNRATRTYDHIARSGRFGVNILGSHLREVSDHCGQPGADKVLAPRWLSDDGYASPALAGALAFVDCDVWQDTAAGTHAVLLGAVRAIGISSSAGEVDPLLHFRGAYRQLQPRPVRVQPKPLPISLQEVV